MCFSSPIGHVGSASSESNRPCFGSVPNAPKILERQGHARGGRWDAHLVTMLVATRIWIPIYIQIDEIKPGWHQFDAISLGSS